MEKLKDCKFSLHFSFIYQKKNIIDYMHNNTNVKNMHLHRDSTNTKLSNDNQQSKISIVLFLKFENIRLLVTGYFDPHVLKFKETETKAYL